MSARRRAVFPSADGPVEEVEQTKKMCSSTPALLSLLVVVLVCAATSSKRADSLAVRLLAETSQRLADAAAVAAQAAAQTALQSAAEDASARAEASLRAERDAAVGSLAARTVTSEADRAEVWRTRGPACVAVLCCFDGPVWMQRRYTAVVANALVALPLEVPVQGFHRENEAYARGLALNKGLDRLRRRDDRLVLTAFPQFMANLKRSDLMLSNFLWESALSDVLLFFGSGGAFCANSPHALADFLPHRYMYGEGGGLVLVRRDDALAVTRAAIEKQASSETRYVTGMHNPLGWLHDKLKMHTLPRSVVAAFSAQAFNASTDALPFSIASTLPKLGPAERGALIEACPEIKVIFPSLHDSNCFGAKSTLNRDKCYESLCVTHPKASGC